LKKASFVKPYPFRYPSFDKLSIPAFFYKPKSRGRSPLLVYLHGGPESQFRPGFSPLIQYLLSLGVGVAVPNFRGSTGYGKRFTHLDDVRKRMDTVKDVREMLSYLADKVGYDHERVAAWGGSYGGFMVLACLFTNPGLWRAGVDIVGIANFVTFLNNTGPWRRKLRILEYGDPVTDKKFLDEISPVHNARHITAPLFIIHGTNDPRVPIEEAEQMAATLEKLGREVHLMKFEDEGHGLVKLKNRIAGYSASVDFLVEKLLL
jgi:dipeptidyl aminopeptidase/acylaminoacyl peptidase